MFPSFELPADLPLVIGGEQARALIGLAALDGRKSRVVELRFFGRLTIDETADVLKVSSMTVMRDWDFAKAWLRRELRTG